MKTIALGAVASVGLVTAAVALQTPIPSLPAQGVVVLAKCPQPSFKRCVEVCHSKYKGTRCEAWCREKGCK